MKRILKFGAVLTAVCLMLVCVVACGGPGGGSGDSGDQGDSDTPIEGVPVLPPATLPESKGDNPFGSGTGVLKTFYDRQTGTSYEKWEFSSDGTMISYWKKGTSDWVKEMKYKYSWDTTEKKIYVTMEGRYLDDKLYTNTNKNELITWAVEGEKKYYEEDADYEGLTLDQYLSTYFKLTWDKYSEMLKKYYSTFVNFQLSQLNVYTYSESGGKFTLDGFYTDITSPGYWSRNRSNIPNVKIMLTEIDFEDDDGEIAYDYVVFDNNTITYVVEPIFTEIVKDYSLPDKIVANYKVETVEETVTATVTFTLNGTEVTGKAEWKPETYYEL